jgi:homocysteine S-methyltransferase
MRIHDGAYGTLLEQHLHGDETVDDLSLRLPSVVVDAHRAYLEAGAQAIQTNAFLVHLRGSSRRRRELRHAALACAREAAATASIDHEVLVVATIGPDGVDARGFWEPIEQALEADVRALLCETVTDARTARAFEAAWREVGAGVQGVEVLLGCSVAPSRGPEACRWVVDLAGDLDGSIALGLNCCEGPTGLRPVLDDLAERRGSVWAMPSAGLPTVTPGAPTTWPFEDPERWAEATLEAIDDLPVAALGGCCGTAPRSIAALQAH